MCAIYTWLLKRKPEYCIIMGISVVFNRNVVFPDISIIAYGTVFPIDLTVRLQSLSSLSTLGTFFYAWLGLVSTNEMCSWWRHQIEPFSAWPFVKGIHRSSPSSDVFFYLYFNSKLQSLVLLKRCPFWQSDSVGWACITPPHNNNSVALSTGKWH